MQLSHLGGIVINQQTVIMRKIIFTSFILFLAFTSQAQWTTSGSNIYFNTGNVGIGAISPAYKLDVTGDIRANSGWLRVNNGFGLLNSSISTSFESENVNYWLMKSDRGLRIANTSGVQQGYLFHNNAGSFGLLDGDGSWAFKIQTNNHNAFYVDNSEKMRITTSGYVGIGKTAPGYPLDVSGAIHGTQLLLNGHNAITLQAGTSNLFIGRDAGVSITTATRNVHIGRLAGNSTTSGLYNLFVGPHAGRYNTSGDRNTFLGDAAGHSTTTGDNNTFVGQVAGYDNTTGTMNAYFGYAAGNDNTTGSYNTLIGTEAGHYTTTASNNTFVGHESGRYTSIGNQNTFVGRQTGRTNTSGKDNTAIGYQAGYTNATGDGNVFLGNKAGFNETGSNKLYIGNAPSTTLIYGDFSTTRVGIGTTSPTHTLDVAGTINATEILVNGSSLSGASLWGQASSDLYFSSGKVAIGTSTLPTDKLLQLDGTTTSTGISLSNSGLGAAHLYWDEANKDLAFLGSRAGGANMKFTVRDASNNYTDALYLKNDGDIGIGTTNPTQQLHIVTPTNAGGLTLESTATQGASYLTFKDVSGTANILAYPEVSGSDFDNSLVFIARNGKDFKFSSDVGSGQGGVKMTLKNDGSLGVGTDTPETMLHVAGAGKFEGDLQLQGGNLIIGHNGYIDNDATFGEHVDDWIRLRGFIELKSNTDFHGLVMRDKDNGAYVNIAQVQGISYFADSGPYNTWFLAGDEANVMVRGELSVFGGNINETDGSLSINSEDNVYIGMDYTDNDADTQAIMFGKNDKGGATNWEELMRIDEGGNVGIGTATPQSKLAVDGIITSKEVNVTATGWPDYVFESDYELMSLEEIEKFIADKGHLPEVPTAQEVASNGLMVGEMNALLLKKIEELTLHQIELKRENLELKELIKDIYKKLNK